MAKRGVRGGLVARCMALAAAGALLVGTAHADLTIPDPPETKRVPATITVDWGPFGERMSRLHIVKAGETLRAIARKYLDDAERWQEIAEENPGQVVEPDVIQIGAKLWVPPKNRRTGEKDESATRHDALAHRYEVYWAIRHRFRRALAERASPGVVPDARKAGGTLMFATPEHARSLIEASKNRGQDHQGVAWGGALWASMYPETLLAAEDPTVRIAVHYEFTGRSDTSVTMKTTRVRYDADDEPVTEEYAIPKSDPWGGKGVDEPPEKGDDGAIRWSEDVAPHDDGPARWSTLAGVVVAFLGLVIVAGAAYSRRRAARMES